MSDKQTDPLVPSDVEGRTFSLNSPEFYEAVCPREDRLWIPNGALPREPHWGRRSDPLIVSGVKLHQQFQDEDEADAFSRWLAHVEAGRIG